MRLDKFISQSLGITRKETKQLLRQAAIMIDNKNVCRPELHVMEDNKVTFDGRPLTMPGPLYIMLNKPLGCICSTKDSRHTTVLELIDEPRVHTLHPVGRLDIDTTGLVLLTSDGQWSHGITSPKRQKTKCYRVQLAEPLIEGVESELSKGIMLDGETKPTLPAQLERINETEVLLSIQEGRYHQVKRMFAAIGNHVVALHRESIGKQKLDDDLALGEYRHLTDDEIEALR